MIDKYNNCLNYLIINCSFLDNLGLFHGRMGIVLFLSYCAHKLHNKQHEELSGYLLDDIYEKLHREIPINLEDGLCGIGWGVEYLVQHGFMEGNTDEILSDIDKKVMEIDLLHLNDLSFRRGLAGIAFYIIARLNAKRDINSLPFDDIYLCSLQKALKKADFVYDNEIPINLEESLNSVLHGKRISISIPDFLIHSNLSLDDDLDNMPLGLENGLSGMLWKNINEINLNYCREKSLFPKGKYLYLIDEETRSSNYGIGTYIDQIVSAFCSTDVTVVHVVLASSKTNTISFDYQNNKIKLYISRFRVRGNSDDIILMKSLYYRNAFFALFPYFIDNDYSIFHLNTMQLGVFALLLKRYFSKSKIILTVHYTNWSFDLLGDRKKLQDVLSRPITNKEQYVYKEFDNERRLMLTCNHIIAIAQHSYKDIVNLYNIPNRNVTLIPHGIFDKYHSLSENEIIERRRKYGFSEDEILLVFAGRIDSVKGVEYLAETFVLLSKRYSKLRLIIIGDGDFGLIFSKLSCFWSKVIFTGFVNKTILYELYSISDIGVLPSLHEEFGYVALEMMMMSLPIVVTETTGLSELIAKNKCGISVNWRDETGRYNIHILRKYISLLIENKQLRKHYAKRARLVYLEKYSFNLFQQRMVELYKKIVYEKL